jgi:hypothetical protein
VLDGCDFLSKKAGCGTSGLLVQEPLAIPAKRTRNGRSGPSIVRDNQRAGALPEIDPLKVAETTRRMVPSPIDLDAFSSGG